MSRPGFFDGMTYPFLGLKHLLDHRELWPSALKAVLVGLVLFIALATIAAAIVLGLPARLGDEGFEWKAALLGCAAVVLGLVVGIVLFALIGNIVAGPFLESMTERMLKDAGRLIPPPRPYWTSFRNGLVDQAGRFGLFLAVQAGLLVLLVTPLLFLHAAAAAGVTIFFVALEHLEYPLEARGLRFFPRIGWALRRPDAAMGFGTTLFFVMPVAGFILLPAAVCGAVLLERDLEGVTASASGPAA